MTKRRVERARPLLGTLVSIRILGLDDDAANAAITDGFGVVGHIHALMSFHETGSDISRLNREAHAAPVRVDPHTYKVIESALAFSAETDGVFDITIAPQLVDWGFLPRPEGAPAPDATATWRDIDLIAPNTIRFAKPLWIDLGGIAKGYAVDCAMDRLPQGAGVQSCINAGGDLRVAGEGSEPVILRTETANGENVPVIEIENGAIASSTSRGYTRQVQGRDMAAHVDGIGRNSAGLQSFVSVVAETCMVADALTKVVLARGHQAASVLRKYGAVAYLNTPLGDWQVLGETS